jgi:hypothetical protein
MDAPLTMNVRRGRREKTTTCSLPEIQIAGSLPTCTQRKLVLVSAIFFSEAPPTPISLSSTGSPSWRKSSETIVSCAQAPPRLAGNVLVWRRDNLTLRLEGAHLTLQDAETLAENIE